MGNNVVSTSDLLGILDARTKRLPGYAHKLQGNQYAFDVEMDTTPDIDESRMMVVIPFADGRRRDGVGDLLEVGGIRMERHRSNPIVLFDHAKQVHLPVALAEDPDTGQYTVEIDTINRVARAKAFFYQGGGLLSGTGGKEYDHRLFCDQLFDLIAQRYVRAGSIGYQVIHAKSLPADHETGIPQGLHLMSVLMLELSAVVLPANGDTVRKALSLPTICGKPMSPMLVKSLSPYAPPRRVQMGHSGKKKSQIVGDLNWLKEEQGELEHGEENKPSLMDIRQQYRKRADGFRRRVRRSSAGSSVLHLSSSDVEKVRKLCSDMGIKFHHLGSTENGTEKIKLTGDDEAIDTVAKKHGKLQRRKSKPKENKSHSGGHMGKVIKREVKAAPPGMPPRGGPPRPKPATMPGAGHTMDDDDEDIIPDDGSMGPTGEPGVDLPMGEGGMPEGGMGDDDPADETEPYGAQVLRRMHEDYKILMEDYHSMMKVLEHEHVRGHLLKVLEQIEREMTETEALWGEAYAEVGQLEGAMGSDLEEEGGEFEEEAGEGLEEEGEEEFDEGEEDLDEGEHTEHLNEEGEGDDELNEMEPEGHEAASGDDEEVDPDEALEGMHKMRRKRLAIRLRRQKRLKAKAKGFPKAPGGKRGKRKHPWAKGSKKSGPEFDVVEEAIDEHSHTTNPHTEFALKEHEQHHIGDAAHFLGELAQAGSEFGDEHKMNAFHHHKNLETISLLTNPHPGGEHEKKSSSPFDDQHEEHLEDEEEHKDPSEGHHDSATGEHFESPYHEHRARAKEGSDFLHGLANEKAFGDTHRKKCGMWCKTFTDVLGHYKKKEGMEGGSDAPPGQAETKKIKGLKKLFEKQNSQMAALSEKLEQINGKIL